MSDDLSRNLEIKRYTEDGFDFESSSFRGNPKGMKKPTLALREHVRNNPTEPAPKVRGYVVNTNMEYVKEDKFRKKTGGLRAGISAVEGKVTNKPTNTVTHNFSIASGVDVREYLPTLRDFGLNMNSEGTKFFKIYKNGVQIGDAQVEFKGRGFKNDTRLFSVFMKTSDESNLESGHDYTVKMFEFEDLKFSRQKFPQIYAGVGTCVFEPILKHYNDTKETDYKQRTLTTIKRLMDKFPDGCDEEAMQLVASRMKSRLNVFTATNKLIACYEPKKKDGTNYVPHTTYNYVNTEMNHVDNWTIKEFYEKPEEIINVETSGEMQTIYKSLENQPFLFSRSDRIQGMGGISFIETKDARYKLVDPTRKMMTELMNTCPEIFCNMYAPINKFETSVLNFVNQATYINGLHTLDENCDLSNLRGSIQEHDITKAYATFYESDLFEDYGLPRPPTDFIECVGHDPLTTISRIGWTQITNVVLDRNKASHNLSNLVDNNVYPNVELKKLWTLGVRFDVINTAYTVSKPHTSFRFTEPYLQALTHPDFEGQKPYAIIVGMMSCCSLSNSTNYKYVREPPQEWIDNLTAYDNNIKKVSICKEKKTLMLHKPKDKVSSMCHVASYITAYVRCRMYEQIDKYQHPVMVNSDCIKFISNGELLPEGWKDKTENIFLDYKEKFSGYHNGKPIQEWTWGTMKSTDLCALLPQFVFFNGPGGTGKTTDFMNCNLMDKALTFPTHSLKADKMNNKQGIYCFTHHRYFPLGESNGLVDKKKSLKYEPYWHYKNIFVDEITMRDTVTLQTMIDFALKWGQRIIFAGDVHFAKGIPYQLEPVKEKFSTQPLIEQNCKEIPFTTNYRCKDQNLLNKITIVRKNMTNHIEAHDPSHFKVNKLNDMFSLFFKESLISRESVFELFDDTKDLILCATHLAIDGYNEEMRKKGFKPIYQLTDDYKPYKKGEIFWGDDALKLNTKNKKESWGTTVHSVQGKTFSGRLFINYQDFFELGMFYTAVSRVRYLDQIRLIKN